jgi:hypothetical protein
MIVETVLSARDQPFERIAAAYCVRSLYHLDAGEYSKAWDSLRMAGSLCSRGSAYLRSLHAGISECARISEALAAHGGVYSGTEGRKRGEP